ncbi:MAG: YggS family pyridoxal phosphate-dependent enzyme [Clostridiales bacterium]|nr:YggS family pyridoxal phosphate-dependent enzyme [Clostridiales bacterium]
MERSYIEKACASVEEGLKAVRHDIEEAAVKSGRDPGEVTLMAVTKTVEPVYINYAISKGVRLIGENKVQEFLGKKDELDLSRCKAHLIGHLQTNKVGKIVGNVDMIESVDSVKLAGEIGRQSVTKGIVTDILVEVNVGNDENKFGITVGNAPEIIDEISRIGGVRIRGLMTVPPFLEDAVETRKLFCRMRQLFIDIDSKKIDNVYMDILSMGMSGDFREAVAEGSTLVRVGSAIFGQRNYR